jgi:hypothetical protein
MDGTACTIGLGYLISVWVMHIGYVAILHRGSFFGLLLGALAIAGTKNILEH